ncbi:hypothetical protein J14TS2_10830 [Bacillus sp. J14TS2]|nr:hypothetical protein J14TS2_10830 [Bacillus sp. J14TS2]
MKALSLKRMFKKSAENGHFVLEDLRLSSDMSCVERRIHDNKHKSALNFRWTGCTSVDVADLALFILFEHAPKGVKQ